MMPSTAVALDNGGCPSLGKGCEILSAEGELGGHLMLEKNVAWQRVCKTGFCLVLGYYRPKPVLETFEKCYRSERPCEGECIIK